MLIKFLQGKGKLWQAFWLWSVLPCLLFGAYSALMMVVFFKVYTAPQYIFLLQYIFLFQMVWIFFGGILALFCPYINWRCSANASSKITTILVRLFMLGLAVLWIWRSWWLQRPEHAEFNGFVNGFALLAVIAIIVLFFLAKFLPQVSNSVKATCAHLCAILIAAVYFALFLQLIY